MNDKHLVSMGMTNKRLIFIEFLQLLKKIGFIFNKKRKIMKN